MKKFINSLVICVLLINPFLHTAAAQSSPNITTNEAIVNFPQGITFHLLAKSDEVIQSVVLRYGTNGQSCQEGEARQSLKFDPSIQVDSEWTWEFKRSGILPPGAQVWWQWEIGTASGATTTDRASAVIQDQRLDWHRLTQGSLNLQWTEGSSSFGSALFSIAKRSLQRLEGEMGISPSGEIWITIYPTPEDVQEAMIVATDWTGGVAFPEYNGILLGISPGELDWAASSIPHELSHLVVGALTFNCQGVGVPTWLGEGLAGYAEGAAHIAQLDRVKNALRKGSLPRLSSLAEGFSAYAEDATLAYEQSYQAVSFMYQRFGTRKMGDLLTALHDGLDIDPALISVYDMDTDGLDAAWRASLGFSLPDTATPYPETDATATPVPTLALMTSVVRRSPTPSPILTPTQTATKTVTATPTGIEAVTNMGTEIFTPTATTVPDLRQQNRVVSLPLLIGGTIGLLFLIAILTFILFYLIKKRGRPPCAD